MANYKESISVWRQQTDEIKTAAKPKTKSKDYNYIQIKVTVKRKVRKELVIHDYNECNEIYCM
jgi:hypothetical protein